MTYSFYISFLTLFEQSFEWSFHSPERRSWFAADSKICTRRNSVLVVAIFDGRFTRNESRKTQKNVRVDSVIRNGRIDKIRLRWFANSTQLHIRRRETAAMSSVANCVHHLFDYVSKKKIIWYTYKRVQRSFEKIHKPQWYVMTNSGTT